MHICPGPSKGYKTVNLLIAAVHWSESEAHQPDLITCAVDTVIQGREKVGPLDGEMDEWDDA